MVKYKKRKFGDVRGACKLQPRTGGSAVFLEYVIQNWTLILIAIAFAITLKIIGLQDRVTVKRMYILTAGVLCLSFVVFTEFYLVDIGGYLTLRTVLMAFRYSATPIITAMIVFALQKMRWFIFIPALMLTAVNIISIFTGIVFSLDDDGTLRRGLLGYLPYIVAGLYGVVTIYILYRDSNKLYTEILPIVSDVTSEPAVTAPESGKRGGCGGFSGAVLTFLIPSAIYLLQKKQKNEKSVDSGK